MLDRIQDGRTDLVFDYVAQAHAASEAESTSHAVMRWCAYYGDVSALRFLLSKGYPLAALGANLDLNGAVFHGHWQLCQFLIEQGADVTHPLTDTGETPLHAAFCAANRPATHHIVRLLLAAGADPNAVTKPAAETGGFMRDCRTRSETPLHRAAAFGDEDTIASLLDARAAKDARDMNGDTPLTWASWHLRPAAVLRLLCFDGVSIHPAARWTGDHGRGWTGLDAHLLGTPHIPDGFTTTPAPGDRGGR